MSILDETRFIERLQFFDGQRLDATDLQGIDDFNREMRWLHNYSLHQPGVGSGFAVHGRKGDREVTIGPAGYAIDNKGREIILTHPVIEPIPPKAGGNGQPIFYYLVVSYPEDLPEAETRAGICIPDIGTVRRQEEPVFCWAELEMSAEGLKVKDKTLNADILSSRRIILAQIEVLNCQLNQPLCITHRFNARPDCGPRIAAGKTSVTSTKKNPDGSLDVHPRVNTSSGRFILTPCYSARLAHEGSSKANYLKLLFGIPQIVDPTPTGFSLQILFPRAASEESEIRALPVDASGDVTGELQDDGWHIVWMGIEA